MKQAYGYSTHKASTKKRLSRIEGQVRGIRTMVDSDKYCIDILTQIAASQRALDAVALQLLNSHVAHCMTLASKNDRTEKSEELMDAVKRLVRVK